MSIVLAINNKRKAVKMHINPRKIICVFLAIFSKHPIFCTKIASKLTRTYTDKHGLKDLCKELLNIDLSKKEQTSDWSVEELSKEQLEYAASDVLYLHELKKQLEEKLKKLDRFDLAQDCFNFIKTRAYLDLNGWSDIDIFEH